MSKNVESGEVQVHEVAHINTLLSTVAQNVLIARVGACACAYACLCVFVFVHVRACVRV